MPNSFIPTRLNDLTVDVSLSGVARGDVLYRGASKWNNLAAGTSGKFLRTNGAGADPTWETAGVTDHGALTGLSDDDHTIYVAIAGRSGGQTINGDTASGGNLTLMSTAHGTKGEVRFNGTAAHINAAGDKLTLNTNRVIDLAVNSVGIGDTPNVSLASVGIGYAPVATGVYSIAIGAYATNAYNYSIALRGVVTAANQFVAGMDGAPISDVYYGSGVTATVPAATTIHGTGGSGTNIAGANFYAAGGRPTGNANGGSFIIQTAAPGASGTTLRDLVDRVTVDTNGAVTLPDGGTITVGPAGQYAKMSQGAIELGRSGSIVYLDVLASIFKIRGYGSYTDQVSFSSGVSEFGSNVQPLTDDTYYLGRNDDDSPKAWKGVILKDQGNGKYYRLEMVSGVITATDLTD